MHDWGDMLVHAGFAEPVMDMERITLTWETPAALLAELRELGANLHPAPFPGLARRALAARRLERSWRHALRGPDGRLALTFEIIYGHALKPAPAGADGRAKCGFAARTCGPCCSPASRARSRRAACCNRRCGSGLVP